MAFHSIASRHWLILLLLATPMLATAGEAKGTLTHKGANVALRHAYLVTGPDVFDRAKTIRKIILTPRDFEAKLRGCKTLNCVSEEMNEGMTIEFDGGPVLKYWLVRNNQNVQHSDTASPKSFTARRDEPGHIAGQLTIDDSDHGGPKVMIDFDAPLIKEYK